MHKSEQLELEHIGQEDVAKLMNEVLKPSNITRVGRNKPCPCGAKHPNGRPIKWKYCHGRFNNEV